MISAGVAFTGTERDKIEKLCRYIARPAVSLERLSLNARGQVVYRLKKPYSDGTTHIVMSQMELLERLAAIVPRPRVHLTRFAGVFAPHYKYRSMVVLKPMAKAQIPESDEAPAKSRIHWAQLLKRVFGIDVDKCLRCQGPMRIISAIEDPLTIKKILTHLGVPHKPPMPWPARGPPDLEALETQQQFDVT